MKVKQNGMKTCKELFTLRKGLSESIHSFQHACAGIFVFFAYLYCFSCFTNSCCLLNLLSFHV